MVSTPYAYAKKYPLHTMYKEKRESAELVRDFLEWLIEHTTNFKRGGPLPPAYGRVRAKTLNEMTDPEKEKMILAFFDIDRDAFHKEKDLMVETLRST